MVQFFTCQVGDVLFGDSQAGIVLNGAILNGIAVGLHPPQDRLQGPELLSDRTVPVLQYLNIPLPQLNHLVLVEGIKSDFRITCNELIPDPLVSVTNDI